MIFSDGTSKHDQRSYHGSESLYHCVPSTAALVNKLGESGASGLQADSHAKGGVKSAALAAAQACSKAQVEACMKVRHQKMYR